jgi:hypothetical protein
MAVRVALRLATKIKVVTLKARVNLVGRKLGLGNRGSWGSNEGHRVLCGF